MEVLAPTFIKSWEIHMIPYIDYAIALHSDFALKWDIPLVSYSSMRLYSVQKKYTITWSGLPVFLRSHPINICETPNSIMPVINAKKHEHGYNHRDTMQVDTVKTWLILKN